ncbi:inosose dehydratase [Mangrovactinospora gilvigrisea]|uniref:Inosose dehydratase n=1 Tax=Mangrovactinospora gilvigrisea TaxID=1428644 RepID=A0A1J7BS28_9ACTN|nr:TIM barrel protein [Mangrovactinospora gilvigrisea]OIV36265.1 inosose dehydratase [Mangrovactinospora gilvigrisea]
MSLISRDRIAGAPISWGVCEVPGWGHQMDPARVLAEMAELGLAATEFGPDFFLPADPAARSALLAGRGLTAIGGFVPAVLHDPGHDPIPEVRATAAAFASAIDAAAAPGGVLVLAAATGQDGYDARPELDAPARAALLANLDRAIGAADEAGLTAVLHPHVGTMVETAADVDLVLDGSSIPLCLDTGHLLVGGTDPVELARRAAPRIGHVHLKDVDAAAAADVREGRTPYAAAVRAGLFRPLGKGDVDIAALVRALEAAGYRGWYVMEQDLMLDAEPAPGTGPIDDVRTCIDHLENLAR